LDDLELLDLEFEARRWGATKRNGRAHFVAAPIAETNARETTSLCISSECPCELAVRVYSSHHPAPIREHPNNPNHRIRCAARIGSVAMLTIFINSGCAAFAAWQLAASRAQRRSRPHFASIKR
jgi:hypothetical protein